MFLSTFSIGFGVGISAFSRSDEFEVLSVLDWAVEVVSSTK